MALQSPSARIHMDFRSLPNLHALKLGLFKIGGDPHFVERHHGEKLLSVLNVHPNHYRFIHFTVDRGKDLRISEIQLGLFQKRALLLNIRDRSLDARSGGRYLLWTGLRILVVGISAADSLARAPATVAVLDLAEAKA